MEYLELGLQGAILRDAFIIAAVMAVIIFVYVKLTKNKK